MRDLAVLHLIVMDERSPRRLDQSVTLTVARRIRHLRHVAVQRFREELHRPLDRVDQLHAPRQIEEHQRVSRSAEGLPERAEITISPRRA